MCANERSDTSTPRAVALRALLNEWDVIGVVPHGILDEYDCLIPTIVERLDAGAGPAGIQEFLDGELPGHFGLSGGRTPERDRMVERLFDPANGVCPGPV